MVATKTTRWDVVEHLKTEADMAAYLEACFEEDDPALVADALGLIARARGMTQMAKETKLGREGLYKALSPEGNPTLATMFKVTKALGLKLSVSPRKVA